MFRKTILPLMLMTTLLTPLAASAETFPNPVISRNCPAYAGNNPATASAGNDDFYYSFWSGSAPDYLAYDLSGVPEEERKVIDAVWYNPSAYDVIGMYVNRLHNACKHKKELDIFVGRIARIEKVYAVVCGN